MRPKRENLRGDPSSHFVSTQTQGRKPFFRHERWEQLVIDTLNHYDGLGYALHAYVIMPDHLHLLITPMETLEKAVQLVKGGFSFRAKRELEWNGELWQPGFTDHRIRDEEDWDRHLEYIRQNPFEARLVSDDSQYEFVGFPRREFPQGLKPSDPDVANVRAQQFAEKHGNLVGLEENWPSVAKATCDSVGFLRGLKLPTPSVLSFSAACKARTLQSAEASTLQSDEARKPSIEFLPRPP